MGIDLYDSGIAAMYHYVIMHEYLEMFVLFVSVVYIYFSVIGLSLLLRYSYLRCAVFTICQHAMTFMIIIIMMITT